MKTLKNKLKQKNVDSDNLRKILINYSHKDKVKVALYAAEDCFHIDSSKQSKNCIDLVKKWLIDKKSVTAYELKNAAQITFSSDVPFSCWAASWTADTAAYCTPSSDYLVSVTNAAADAFGQESKLEEYFSYARLFAYQDLDFPYRKEARTFNLDNPTDLNIFLDFLTDNYPTAITYPREEYFKTKLAKEYLKVIYQ